VPLSTTVAFGLAAPWPHTTPWACWCGVRHHGPGEGVQGMCGCKCSLRGPILTPPPSSGLGWGCSPCPSYHSLCIAQGSDAGRKTLCVGAARGCSKKHPLGCAPALACLKACLGPPCHSPASGTRCSERKR